MSQLTKSEHEAARASLGAELAADVAALEAAEARGYARGELAGYERHASAILGPKHVQEMMELYVAEGYARGVEEAADMAEKHGSLSAAFLAPKLRGLLKPKGEAK